MSRFARRVDINQPKIVKGLRAVPGVSVHHLGGTIDLCVGYEGRNYLMEVKQPNSEKKLKPSQIKFIQEWTGQVNVVTDLQDALLIIGAVK